MNPGSLWKKELRTSGYEHHASVKLMRKLIRLNRIWRRIFKILLIDPWIKNRTVFEVGCGGGIHLVQFALRGWRCFGLDVSREVLGRAKQFISEVEQYMNRQLAITLYAGDILDFEIDSHKKFDLVFHVGVLEHFLDDSERHQALQKMFALAKPGGYVVCIVPSGMHPWRKMMKEQKLGGYNIPEIDYTPELMTRELKDIGGENIKVLPHNLCGYLLLKKSLSLRILFLIVQIIPLALIPRQVAFRYCSSLIGIAQKI